MKAFTLRAAIVVAGLSLAAGSAWAQGDRGSAGGGGGGGDRGGGGANTASGGGGGNAGASSSGGFSGGSASSSASSGGSSFGSAPSGGSGGSGGSSFGSQRAGSVGGFREVAPMHRSGFNYSESGASARAADGQQRAVARSSGSSSSSSGSSGSSPRSTASPAPRSNAGSSGSSGGSATPRRTGGENNGSNANNSNPNREVPNWSRPRGNQPATGTAVTRTTPVPDRNGFIGGRYYDPYLFYGGLGFGFYDYYSPYYYPYGALGGYGGYGMMPGYGDPFYSDPYSYGAGYGSYSNSLYDSRNQGAIKLKVKPNNAKVYVDGYFVGYVNQFDGAFQKLSLNGGQHKVEVKADGYETSEFDVLVTPDKTVTFAGDLKKLQ